jgi:hypothetical protein
MELDRQVGPRAFIDIIGLSRWQKAPGIGLARVPGAFVKMIAVYFAGNEIVSITWTV